MAQADSISTAIRQLLSRGWPPKFTSPVRLAHSKLVAALAGNAPHPIYAGVEADDLDGRPDHQEKVFAALHAYNTRPASTCRDAGETTAAWSSHSAPAR
jgi:hypothetical protein